MSERENPFKHIYKACNQRDSKMKLNNLPEFARCIDIELTNTCNFRCLMCHTGTQSLNREQGFMSDALYYRILDEIKEYGTALRFIRWGEPTLHPRLFDYIQAAKDAGLLCHMNTNGSKLTEAMIDKIINIPLDSIKFSFQGVDRKSYRQMRNTDFYEELLDVVKRLYERRGDREYPYIHVSTTITYETNKQVSDFKRRVGEFVDLVTVGRTVMGSIDIDKVDLSPEEKDVLKMLKSQESVVKERMRCPEVFDKLSINWDGTVSACCGDYDKKMIAGDMAQSSLKEIWDGQKMNHYRELISDMRYDELDLCRNCYDYHGLQTPGLQGIDD